MSKAHRLAAIMFTDIQGYTKLMQEDEDKAIEIRNRHREIFQHATSKNDGEVIQYYGDGTLSIFESCVDAVRCAKEMQDQFQSYPMIPVRIGIHLGDIVLSGVDIIGDSVNVASRVESLGVAGSVLISQKVYQEIHNKQEFKVKNLGAFHFKNDKEPRTIYAVMGGNLVIPQKHELQGKLETNKRGKRTTRIYLAIASVAVLAMTLGWIAMNTQLFNRSISSLAVLPLYDRIGLSSDEAYIIEGLHEEIIAKLSKAGLEVKPYSTMVQYSANPKTPKDIGEELEVDGLVEGSLFRSDDVYRIRVQVIDVANQQYVTEPFEAEAEFSEIMNIYEELVGSIAEQIKYTLSDEVQAQLTQSQTQDSEAYDLYLKGRYYLNKGSPQDVRTAIEYYNLSLKVDPGFGDVHVSLAESYLLLGFASDNPSDELEKFRFHLASAAEQDPFFARNHHLIAMDKVFDNWDWTGAAIELEKAIEASPDAWEPFDSYCQLMWAIGDMDKSIAAGKKAVKIAPDAHYAQCDLAWAYYFDRNYAVAKKEVDKTITLFGTDCPNHAGLSLLIDIAQKIQIGQSLVTTIDRIEREVDSTGALPIYNLSLLGYAHALDGNHEKAIEILEEMESKGVSGADKVYAVLGEFDKAFDILDASISNRSFFQMFVIKQAPWYDPLSEDPRYDHILTRMGLNDHQLKR